MRAYQFEANAAVLDDLAADINRWAKEKGFWNIPKGETEVDQARIDRMKKMEKLALIASETVGEALEAVRKNPSAPSEHIPEFTAEEEEIADIVIRSFDYAGEYKLRIGMAVAAKMAFNEGRPFMHGKHA